MKRIATICGIELKRQLIKKKSFIIMIAMPLLFTFFFGGLSGEGATEKTKVLLVDEDDSSMSKDYIQTLQVNNILFEIEKVETEREMRELLVSKDAAAALVIPSDFDQKVLDKNEPDLVFLTIPEFTESGPIQEVIKNRLTKLRLMVAASQKWSEYSGEEWPVMYEKIAANTENTSLSIEKINVEQKTEGSEVNGASTVAPGFSIMFVMVMMMSVTGTIIEARSNGVWSRLLTAPASRFDIAAGYLLYFFIIGCIQFSILIVATRYLFGVRWGDPLALIILTAAMLLAVVGIGLLIASLVKTVEQQAGIGNLVVVATCMISGVYWPMEIQPEFMQKMAEFLPQTWAMRGFSELLVNGGGIGDIISHVGLLVGFAALFLGVGVSRMKFE